MSVFPRAYQRSEIGVCAKHGGISERLGGRRWCFDDAGLAAAVFFERVQTLECAFRQTQSIIEDLEDRVVDLEGLADERGYGRRHCCGGWSWVRSVDDVREGEGIVLGDVDELDGVELTVVNV